MTKSNPKIKMTETSYNDQFYQRAEQMGHDPKIIQRDGFHTTRVNISSIQHLRELIGPIDDETRKQNQISFDKALGGEEPCFLDEAVDSYIHGTGALNAEQHEIAATGFPTLVTLTSAADHTLPPGETKYGPNLPPVYLNYGTLTVPYGSWIKTLTTNLTLDTTNLIISPPSTSVSSSPPSYQVGIMGAPLDAASTGTAGIPNTTPGGNGGGGGCIWGGGGCKTQPSGGSPGNQGGNGGPGGTGTIGSTALTAKLNIGTLTGALSVASQGGSGQIGGTGGAGGKGSTGGKGGYGTSCGAASCNGGNGGKGGKGGNGGDGGDGGNGGSAQTVYVTVKNPVTAGDITTNPMSSPVGGAGTGGTAGAGGNGGSGGGSGSGGSDGKTGPSGDSGVNGNNGKAGTSSGPIGQIIVNKP